MARTEVVTNDIGLVRLVTGSILDDAATPDAASIRLGFRPRKIEVMNVTDSIGFDWREGMASESATQTIANGTRSLITSGGITVSGDTIGFPVLQNKQYRLTVHG